MLFDHLRRELADVETKLEEHSPGYSSSLMKRKRAVLLQLDNIVYPVLTLPPEITSEIFIQCLERYYKGNPRFAPLVLLQICKAWKSIALATPQLWTEFDLIIDHPEYDGVPPEGFAQFVDQFMDRAKNLPLSLYLSGNATGAAGYDLEAILQRQAPRLEHLTFSMYQLDSAVLSKPVRVPLLQTLTLNCDFDTDPSTPMCAFRDAPQLRQVAFHSSASRQHFTLPWNQLTRITAAGFSEEDCLQVLRDAPSAKTCIFTGIHGSGPADSLITHSLEELRIHGSRGDLLNSFRFPALQALCLRRIGNNISTQFFQHCSASLQTFTYEGDVDADPISMEWLRPMDKLTTLSLTTGSKDFTSVLLRGLNREVDDHFLPRLRSLRITQATYTVDAPVVAALWSRYTSDSDFDPNAAKLESLDLMCVRRLGDPNYTNQFRWEHAGDDIDWDALADLSTAGMDIYLGPEKNTRAERNFIWEWNAVPQHIVFSP
ncbi:hypothetical protein K438DRAFT_1797611 [Mycena galopus ATCC 62051]|nr:hypothetical protein K438DRAFT_1797611 [Mycena galopus ATCC 62051]